jgi:hypothetical protein
VAGPAHEYPVTLVAPLALSVKELPVHIGPLFDALVSAGALVTVTDGDVTAGKLVQPAPG